MAKLISVEKARTRLNLEAIAKIEQQLSLAIDAVTPHVNSFIHNGTFDRATYIEEFWVDTREFPMRGGGGFVDPSGLGWHEGGHGSPSNLPLRMKNGFTFEDPAALPDPILVDVDIAVFVRDLGDPDARIDVPTSSRIVDPSKGIVMVLEELDDTPVDLFRIFPSHAFYARVTYQAGFTQTDSAFGPVYDNVPDWLQEAAIMFTWAVYNWFVSCEKDGRQGQGGECGCPPSVKHLLEPHIRFFPSALRPMV